MDKNLASSCRVNAGEYRCFVVTHTRVSTVYNDTNRRCQSSAIVDDDFNAHRKGDAVIQSEASASVSIIYEFPGKSGLGHRRWNSIVESVTISVDQRVRRAPPIESRRPCGSGGETGRARADTGRDRRRRGRNRRPWSWRVTPEPCVKPARDKVSPLAPESTFPLRPCWEYSQHVTAGDYSRPLYGCFAPRGTLASLSFARRREAVSSSDSRIGRLIDFVPRIRKRERERERCGDVVLICRFASLLQNYVEGAGDRLKRGI